MHLILGKQLAQNSGDCIISPSLWGRTDHAFLRREWADAVSEQLWCHAAARFPPHQPCGCPAKGRWPSWVSACSGGKRSSRKALEILRRVKCCASGGAAVGGDRKVMQLPFLQNKKAAVMNG